MDLSAKRKQDLEPNQRKRNRHAKECLRNEDEGRGRRRRRRRRRRGRRINTTMK